MAAFSRYHLQMPRSQSAGASCADLYTWHALVGGDTDWKLALGAAFALSQHCGCYAASLTWQTLVGGDVESGRRCRRCFQDTFPV